MVNSNYKKVHIPSGCTVSIGETEDALESVGVLPDDADATINISFDVVDVKGSKNEDVLRYAKNIQATATFSVLQIDLSVLSKLTDGLMTLQTVAGTPVKGQVQTIQSGWVNLQTYRLNAQQHDGGAPTVVVTSDGSTLTEGDDYYLVKQTGSGAWAIYFDTSGSGSPGTGNSISISADYTPSVKKIAKLGSSSISIGPKVVRFAKTQGGKLFQATMFSATNRAGFNFAFPQANNDRPSSMQIEMTAGLDVTRPEGEQLMEIVDEIDES